MRGRFRGEMVYIGEVDDHLPLLTVAQTLEFAAAVRTPRERLPGVSRAYRKKHMTEVAMTIFRLSHTRNTIVGNDFIRGVSGGERKRVSIAEVALSEAAVSAWDNSTKGLDATSAVEFSTCLRILSDSR
jgi:ATP-binding cassette, subfamily G (WHITE), member 2, PDR